LLKPFKSILYWIPDLGRSLKPVSPAMQELRFSPFLQPIPNAIWRLRFFSIGSCLERGQGGKNFNDPGIFCPCGVRSLLRTP
jgi:hypothetical protein